MVFYIIANLLYTKVLVQPFSLIKLFQWNLSEHGMVVIDCMIVGDEFQNVIAPRLIKRMVGLRVISKG